MLRYARFFWDYAYLLFKPDEGIDLGIVRKVLMDSTDPWFPQVGILQNLVHRKRDKLFHFGAHATRQYTKAELDSASHFVLDVGPSEPR